MDIVCVGIILFDVETSGFEDEARDFPFFFLLADFLPGSLLVLAMFTSASLEVEVEALAFL